jgi:hypothetical protein
MRDVPARDAKVGSKHATCSLKANTEQQHWKVPTFQPWYHFDAHLCLQQYFYIRLRIEPNKHTKLDKNNPQEKCSQRGKKCVSKFAKETTPQSPNAYGTTRSNTSREMKETN